ncbi:hypothetical protein P3W85_07940 [Cupriavidus basilensis]|uniref:Uncharacterized protein n=1 Tax=Cupriavidus basilensis TaxID=68895 RepID=A0ABT6AJU8_9BURK|nr:hypothetical protein [Cupriavidus basilensis]MDF3832876.1 hypothetical protein [Cupriavidus basilensis]
MPYPIETQRNLPEAAGNVDAGNLVTFAHDVPAQARQDLLNSNLLAQLAADKQISRFTESAAWYKRYGDTLSNLTWQVTRMRFSRYVPPGLQFNPREIVLAEMSKVESPQNVGLVRNTIDTLNSLPDDARAREVLQRFSSTDHELNLQVSFGDGGSAVDIVCVIFATEEDIVDPLVQEFDVAALKSEIRIALLSGVINERLYPAIRQSVIDKLGDKRGEFIVAVESGNANSLVA